MSRWRLLATCAALLLPDTAHAIDLWPFKSEDETLLEELEEAREAGELNLAEALLERLVDLRSERDPELLLERGRLLEARGELDAAATVLLRAANARAQSPAREELAAIYVRLGRWPDAVNALRLAFEERGSSLPADRVAADPAFAELLGFEPFDGLLQKAREAQAGPMGRMMIRLERLESTAQETMTALERITELITLIARVATSFFLPLLCFILLGLSCTLGAAQLSPLGRPWTLLVGYGAAGAIWVSGTRSLTAGESHGFETVMLGTAVVLGAWLALTVLSFGVKALRARFRPDPWSDGRIDTTLALLSELSALGRAHREGEVNREELHEVTRRALKQLQGRAGRGAHAGEGTPGREHEDGASEAQSATAR